MEVWIDSLEKGSIALAARQGLLAGVTTNPSILANSPYPIHAIIEELLSLQSGPVAVQVTATQATEMVAQAKQLSALNSRIFIKVPVTSAGLQAIHTLQECDVPTMATAVFNSKQFLLAALAGARYIAPYVGVMMEEAGENPVNALQEMIIIRRNYGFKTKLLAAALKDSRQFMLCAELGIDAVTLKDSLFLDIIRDYEPTLRRLERFAIDWRQITQHTFFLRGYHHAFMAYNFGYLLRLMSTDHERIRSGRTDRTR